MNEENELDESDEIYILSLCKEKEEEDAAEKEANRIVYGFTNHTSEHDSIYDRELILKNKIKGELLTDTIKRFILGKKQDQLMKRN